jgi:purine-nucleoside phosphorylase
MSAVPTTSPGAPGANPFEQARIAARELGRLTGADHHDVLVVLGTGQFGAARDLGAEGPAIDLTSLPWFTRLTGPGHRPEAWSVELGASRTLVVAGRLHLYEGRSPAEVAHTVRTAIAAGVRTVVLTGGAGAVNPRYEPGDVVAVADHVNLTGTSPLTGIPADRPSGPGHLDMVGAWSAQLRALARAVEPIAEGVYALTPGPQLETPAEVRMFGAMGVDLVGMSMVPEAIAARHLRADVLGLAVVTSAASGLADGAVDAEECERRDASSAATVARIVRGVVEAVDADTAPGDATEAAQH